MNEKDTNRLLTYYQDALNTFGDHDARSVHWSDEHNQKVRFEILNHIADISDKSILDVGCGLGDLYKYFLDRTISVHYTGIDIVPDFIARAQERFPDARFLTKDIFEMNEEFDYVFASGALSFKVGDHKTYYFNMIRKMFSLAKRGLAFNMLNTTVHIDDETYAAYDPNEVSDFCKTLCSNVQIVMGYLPQDFTIYMLKN